MAMFSNNIIEVKNIICGKFINDFNILETFLKKVANNYTIEYMRVTL